MVYVSSDVFDRIFDGKRLYFWRKVMSLTAILTEKMSVKKSFVKMLFLTDPSKILTDNFRRTDIPSKFIWWYLLTNWHSVSIILTSYLTDSFPVKLIFWPKFWPIIVSVKKCCIYAANIFDGLLRLGPSKILTEDVYPVKNFYIPSKNSTNAIKKVILRTHMFS